MSMLHTYGGSYASYRHVRNLDVTRTRGYHQAVNNTRAWLLTKGISKNLAVLVSREIPLRHRSSCMVSSERKLVVSTTYHIIGQVHLTKTGTFKVQVHPRVSGRAFRVEVRDRDNARVISGFQALRFGLG